MGVGRPPGGKMEPAVREAGGDRGKSWSQRERAPPTQTPSSPDSETGEDDISDVQGTQRLELQDDRDFSTPTGELSGVFKEQTGKLPTRGSWTSPCSFL